MPATIHVIYDPRGRIEMPKRDSLPKEISIATLTVPEFADDIEAEEFVKKLVVMVMQREPDEHPKCAVDWLVLEELMRHYSGDKVCFDADNCTYTFKRAFEEATDE